MSTISSLYIVCSDFILCVSYIGSENNSFCVYHKFVSQPILKYKFDIPHSILVILIFIVDWWVELHSLVFFFQPLARHARTKR